MIHDIHELQKLPKQWKHWMKLARLKSSARASWASYYAIGQNRHWRVNLNGEFECSCPLEEFDRWANSSAAKVQCIPKNQKEFLETVAFLLLST